MCGQFTDCGLESSPLLDVHFKWLAFKFSKGNRYVKFALKLTAVFMRRILVRSLPRTGSDKVTINTFIH